MTAASNEVAAVIQADRDAAADYALASEPNDTAFPYDVRRGYLDKAPVVQAFARYRIAHSDPRPVAEGLREAERIQTLEAALASVRVNLMRDPSRGEAVGEFAAAILRGSTLIEAMISADTRFPAATHSPAPMAGEGDNLTWFSAQRRLSLSFYSPMYGDDDDQSEEWRVHKESGPINDREWDIVGRGSTAVEAIAAARAAAHPSTQEGGK